MTGAFVVTIWTAYIVCRVVLVVEVDEKGTPAPVGGGDAGDQADVAEGGAIAVVSLKTVAGVLVLIAVAGDLLFVGVEVFAVAVGF